MQLKKRWQLPMNESSIEILFLMILNKKWMITRDAHMRRDFFWEKNKSKNKTVLISRKKQKIIVFKTIWNHQFAYNNEKIDDGWGVWEDVFIFIYKKEDRIEGCSRVDFYGIMDGIFRACIIAYEKLRIEETNVQRCCSYADNIYDCYIFAWYLVEWDQINACHTQDPSLFETNKNRKISEIKRKINTYPFP